MSLFCWTQRKLFWRMWETEQFWGTIDFHSIFFPTIEVNGAPKQPGYKLSSKYLPLCSAEQTHSYRFGTTWGWVNDDRIFIFGWTIPLRLTLNIKLQNLTSIFVLFYFFMFYYLYYFYLFIYFLYFNLFSHFNLFLSIDIFIFIFSTIGHS